MRHLSCSLVPELHSRPCRLTSIRLTLCKQSEKSFLYDIKWLLSALQVRCSFPWHPESSSIQRGISMLEKLRNYWQLFHNITDGESCFINMLPCLEAVLARLVRWGNCHKCPAGGVAHLQRRYMSGGRSDSRRTCSNPPRIQSATTQRIVRTGLLYVTARESEQLYLLLPTGRAKA